MTSRSHLPAAVALAVVAALAAGCGSTTTHATSATSSPAAAHASFIAAVNAVCQRAVDAHAGHPFPVPGFDPEHPSPVELPAVGAYFARYGHLSDTAKALRQLEPPTPDAPAWQGLLSLADQVTENATQQIAAADARDVTAFVRTLHTERQLASRIAAAGRRFGFTSSSPCGLVYG